VGGVTIHLEWAGERGYHQSEVKNEILLVRSWYFGKARLKTGIMRLING